MNPFAAQFKKLFFSFSRKQLFGLLVLLFLTLSTSVAVYLVSQKQEMRKKAAEPKESLLPSFQVEEKIKYASDEIIVKFKENSAFAESIDKQLINQIRPEKSVFQGEKMFDLKIEQSLKEEKNLLINLNNELKQKSNFFKEKGLTVVSLEPLIKELKEEQLRPTVDNRNKKTYLQLDKEIKEKFPQRAKRAPKESQAINLTNLYLLKISNPKYSSFSLLPEKETEADSYLNSSGLDMEKLSKELNTALAGVIEYAQPNYLVHLFQSPQPTPTSYPNDSRYGEQWALPKIQAPQAWNTERGKPSTVIAIIDTGIDYSHPDLSGKVSFGYDFYNKDSDPMDDKGHGTHVAGITAAATNNNLGIAGVCPQCLLMPVKFLNAQGIGYTNDAVSAIYYAINHGADILNNSWGGFWYDADLERVIREITQAVVGSGGVFVAAAGNSYQGGNPVIYPAAYEYVLAVGATDINDNIANFSSQGTWVDVSAPGVNVLSTLKDNQYQSSSGTSMAAPHVAGLVGLLLSRNPNLTVNEIVGLGENPGNHTKGIIENMAEDKGIVDWDQAFGWGRINMEATVLAVNPSSPVGLITSPFANTDVYGANVEIKGIVNGNNYQVSVAPGINPSSGWLALNNTAVVPAPSETTLAVWDTNSLRGDYTIRLSVDSLASHQIIVGVAYPLMFHAKDFPSDFAPGSTNTPLIIHLRNLGNEAITNVRGVISIASDPGNYITINHGEANSPSRFADIEKISVNNNSLDPFLISISSQAIPGYQFSLNLSLESSLGPSPVVIPLKFDKLEFVVYRVDDRDDKTFQYLHSSSHDSTGNLYVALEDNRYPQGSNIVFTRSIDSSRTFSAPLIINKKSPSFKPVIAVNNNGSIHLIWLTKGEQDQRQLYYSRSLNFGLSFEKEKQIATVSLFPPKISVNDNGQVVIFWQEDNSDNSKIYFITSADNGLTFAPPRVFPYSLSEYNYSPFVKLNNQGYLFFAWIKRISFAPRVLQLLFTSSSDFGATFSPPIEVIKESTAFISLTSFDIDEQNDVYLVYESFSNYAMPNIWFSFSPRFSFSPKAKNIFSKPLRLNKNSIFRITVFPPQIAVSKKGNKIVIAWGGKETVYEIHSFDRGRTFSEERALPLVPQTFPLSISTLFLSNNDFVINYDLEFIHFDKSDIYSAVASFNSICEDLDFSGDRKINIFDTVLMGRCAENGGKENNGMWKLINYRSASISCIEADLDNNNFVNQNDAEIMKGFFGKRC